MVNSLLPASGIIQPPRPEAQFKGGGPYKLLLADPPWRYEVWSAKGAGRTAEAHYSTMTADQLCALPVQRLAASDSVLLLWATWPMLPDAMRVMAAWGFEYRTAAFVWIKQNRAGWGLFSGMGHYTRANTEPVLLAVRGKGLPRLRKDVQQLMLVPEVDDLALLPTDTILAPVMEHSRKPVETHAKIERLFGDVPRVELFARRTVPGWTCLGNELSGLDLATEIEMSVPR